MELPNELRMGIERELRSYDQRRLAKAAAELSAAYRGEARPPHSLGGEQAAAYATSRMPATYAAASAALAATAAALPAFTPRSLLDLGAGTGAALWAATSTWEALETATLVERDQAMAACGDRLSRGSRRPPVAGASWRQADLTGRWEAPPHDLVTATYVLGELPDVARSGLVARIWGLTAGALVLIEPGTPRGWATIRAARDQLRAMGAAIVAPCPHQGPCPLADDDWCHFPQRIARTRSHRAAKGGELGYEDEKFSYVALARVAGTPIGSRVIRHPIVRPGRIELTLCTPHGVRRELIARGTSAAWRLARDLRCGDALPPNTIEER